MRYLTAEALPGGEVRMEMPWAVVRPEEDQIEELITSGRIRVSKQTVLQGALLGTGFPYKDQAHLGAYLEMFKALIADSAGIRRPGSAALDLAYVAAGRLDGFWEIGLNPWDMAAGVLLVREAGGLVGDLAGGHPADRLIGKTAAELTARTAHEAD